MFMHSAVISCSLFSNSMNPDLRQPRGLQRRTAFTWIWAKLVKFPIPLHQLTFLKTWRTSSTSTSLGKFEMWAVNGGLVGTLASISGLTWNVTSTQLSCSGNKSRIYNWSKPLLNFVLPFTSISLIATSKLLDTTEKVCCVVWSLLPEMKMQVMMK